MRKGKHLLNTIVLVFALAACSSSASLNTTDTSTANNDTSVTSNSTAAETTSVATPAASVDEALADNSSSVTIEGSRVTITEAGTYSLSGTLTDGQVVVNTESEEAVRLILNGINITSSTSAPIDIINASETILILADNTENYVTDGTPYIFDDPAAEEPNAAIFSNGDFSISGNGSLTVYGNFNDGISTDDGLIIASGTLIINAVDDGLRGKDYLVVEDGNIMVNAGDDGLKFDNEDDEARVYILIENGVFDISAGGDAINAQTDVMITTGVFTITAGGGSSYRADNSTSAKGIKGSVNVTIDGGTFTIDAADDGLHSNGNITLNGGTYTIASADDGMHAYATLTINSGSIHITRSYEGIESAVITVNGGDIHIVASDDGINVAGGTDNSGFDGAMGGRPGGGRGGPGMDAFANMGSYYLYIYGGYIAVEAGGDGIDSNGTIEMTDGIVLVNGPTEQMNGALDAGVFTISGGFMVAAGSAGMAETARLPARIRS